MVGHRCGVVNENGKACTKGAIIDKKPCGFSIICRGCTSIHWNEEFETIEGGSPDVRRLLNAKHVQGLTDLSRYQDVIQQIKVILRNNGIDFNEGDVENALLNLLQTKHWDVNLEQCKPRKQGVLPTILFLEDKQDLSLANTVAASFAIEFLHRKQRETRKKQRLSGSNNTYCMTCLPKTAGEGKARTIFASWTKLRHNKDFLFECTTCLIKRLKMLSKTLPYLFFHQNIDDGEGYFLLQNHSFNHDSDDAFFGEQIHCWDLNRPKARKSPAFLLVAAGAPVPSNDDTAGKQKFSQLMRQLKADHDQYLLGQKSNRAKQRDSLDREQQEALDHLGNNIPTLAPEEIDQNVKETSSLIKRVLSSTDANDPALAMGNARSSKATLINGEVSFSGADDEHLRKLKKSEWSLLLVANGGIPLEDIHYTTVSEVGKLNRAGMGDKFQVFYSDIAGAADHDSIRVMEKKVIELIQGIASQNHGRIISTESTNYSPGSKSEMYFCGQATLVLILGWLRLIKGGKLFLNANGPPFFKRRLMKSFPFLKDLRYWKCVGDCFTLDQRLAKNASLPAPAPALANRTSNASRPVPTRALEEHAIMAVQSRKKSRKSLKELNLNIQEEVRDGGDEKPRSIPEEIFGMERLVVSGDLVVDGRRVIDKDTLRVKLEKHKSWLGLELRKQFPKNIRERARVYIFVEGTGASKEKSKLARDNNITTWKAEHLDNFLTKHKI